MGNPIRPYIYEIGKSLANLGNELCRQAGASEPLNLHGVVKSTKDNICFNLHNIVAALDKWKSEMLERDGKVQLPDVFHGTDGVDIESFYCAVSHLLHSNYVDIDSGVEYPILVELQKLVSLLVELQNNGFSNGANELHGSSIIREIDYFLHNETSSICGEQDFFEVLYKRDIDYYNMGFITAEEIQIDNLRHIRMDGDYVVVELWHPTMMISPEDDEDFLVANLAKIRKLFIKRGWTDEMDSLRERGVGIKISVHPPICMHKPRTAVIYLPEDIQKKRL